ncbi:MAG TPA: hypothetical protein VEZ11_08505 [Thermoanaerobaculia bacterium]|nr:hypothetical protein [Thermoanaerobaculia bacterium]
MRKIALPALLLLAACASSTPAPLKTPEWTDVPRTVLDAFCLRTVNEGISRETAIHVYKVTRPLVTGASIAALHDLYPDRRKPDMESLTLAQEQSARAPLPVVIPAEGCKWRPIERYEGPRDHDAELLELSAPIVNPFSRGEAGLFARLSIGNQAPSWYWIPLGNHNERWMVGRILPMDLRN